MHLMSKTMIKSEMENVYIKKIIMEPKPTSKSTNPSAPLQKHISSHRLPLPSLTRPSCLCVWVQVSVCVRVCKRVCVRVGRLVTSVGFKAAELIYRSPS